MTRQASAQPILSNRKLFRHQLYALAFGAKAPDVEPTDKLVTPDCAEPLQGSKLDEKIGPERSDSDHDNSHDVLVPSQRTDLETAAIEEIATIANPEAASDAQDISTDEVDFLSAERFNSLARKARGKGDYEKAFEFQRVAALTNEARSQISLGFMYSSGEGVERNEEEAVYWFREAADQGNPHGQLLLGLRYYFGSRGVERDDEAAIRLFQEAADQDYMPAKFRLGIAYARGRGVERDFKKAAELIGEAIKGGYCEAITTMEVSSLLYGKQFRVEMQRFLRDEGAYSGALDGNFGEATIDALKKYRGNLRIPGKAARTP